MPFAAPGAWCSFMRKIQFLLSLALLCGFAFATTTLAVPAVDDAENGLITSITLSTNYGSGDVVLHLRSTTVSTDTQESMRTAIAEAAKLAGKDKDAYDYSINFGDAIGKVNGPSAGASFALMAYSELSGKALRRDFIATGSISKGGAIGPVGGVKAKIDAVGKDGRFKVMAVPAGQPEEGGADVLDSVFYPDYAMQKYGLTVVFVSNLTYAVGIATGEITPPKTQSREQFIPSEYSPLSSSSPFRSIATDVLSDAATLGSSANLTTLQRSALSRLTVDADTELRLGYYYSAANTAFLVKTALDSARIRDSSPEAFKRLVLNLDAEMSGFQFSEKTASNWEWVAAGQLRYSWARSKLSGVLFSLERNDSSQAAMAEDVATALNWFEAAKSLNAASSPLSLQYRSEAEAKAQAEEYVSMVDGNIGSSALIGSEIRFHLNQSKALLLEGAYYAAMMDASYAYEYFLAENALLEIAADSDAPLQPSLAAVNSTMASMLSSPRFSQGSRSVFADLFFAHAHYNRQVALRNSDYSAAVNAYKLALLSGAFQSIRDYASGGSFAVPSAPNLSLQTAPASFPSSQPSGVVVTVNAPSSASPTPAEDLHASVSVTPNEGPNLAFYGAVAAAVGFVALVVVAAFKLLVGSRSFKTADELDSLVASGKISAEHYERMRKKYFPAPSQPPVSADSKPQPHAQLPSEKSLAVSAANSRPVEPELLSSRKRKIDSRQGAPAMPSRKLNKSFPRARR